MQELVTWYGWERPHKGKGYKAWTYKDQVDVVNKHKFNGLFHDHIACPNS